MEQKTTEYHSGGINGEERVFLWEEGLPDVHKVTPLSQSLITPKLASAFRILMEPCRTTMDVNSVSKTTLLNIRGGQSEAYRSFKSNDDQTRGQDAMMVERDETTHLVGSGSDSLKVRKDDSGEEANLAPQTENLIEDSTLARTLKRPRLAWTPQLHKRFVDVVSHLGLKDAAPKAIMRLMNVDGLTRENVASHLQKYRLYLKRTQLFSTTDEAVVPMPVTQNSHDSAPSADAPRNGHFQASFPMTYVPSPMMPMMFFGMGAHGHGLSHSSMPVVNLSTAGYGGWSETHSLNTTHQQD